MNELLDAIAGHAARRPGAIAVADERRAVTYDALRELVEHRARQLEGIGVVSLALDNGVDWIAWDLAAATAGIVCVPVPPFFSEAQQRHLRSATGADAVIDAGGLSRTNERPAAMPPDTSKVTFTSGSTGSPRGVCLSQQGLVRVARSVVDALEGVPHDRHLCAMPLAVLLENVAGVYAALLAGARIDAPACGRDWRDPATLHRRLAGCRARTVIVVPEMLQGLLGELRRGGPRLPDLAFAAVGGAPVAPALIESARALGIPAYQGYGLSECGSVVALNVPGADRTDTVGRPLGHVRVEITDGEILVADPVGLGYLDGERFSPLSTGDLGETDADGFVMIHGRRKNLLITSYGRNISPEWIETALLERPAIEQAVVCGDGWPRPGALVVAARGAGDSAVEADIEAVNEALPDYARIARWLRVEPFTVADGTLTGTGRVRREPIIHRYLEQLESTMQPATFYQRLVEETRGPRAELYSVPQLVDGLAGRISRETYIAYLAEAYHHVSHTVPFLMAMGARLPGDKRWLLTAVIDYINEEKGHEEWILQDIANAGGDAELVRRSTPQLATRALIAYNYDYIQRRNPVGFLGMVYMLESTSVEVASRGAGVIQDALGLPDDAVVYLRSHGTLDRKHMEFFRDLVNRLDDPADQGAIVEVACSTFRLFADVLRSIAHEAGVRHVA